MATPSGNNPEIDNSKDNHVTEPAISISEEQKKLNEIRNLLFGQNVEEYRTEFGELKSIIQDNKAESEQSIAEFQSDVLSRLENLENKLTNAINATNEQLSNRLDQLDDSKTDRKTLASMLHQIANQLEA